MKLIDHIDKIEASKVVRFESGKRDSPFAEYDDGVLYFSSNFVSREDIPKLAAFLNNLLSEVE